MAQVVKTRFVLEIKHELVTERNDFVGSGNDIGDASADLPKYSLPVIQLYMAY